MRFSDKKEIKKMTKILEDLRFIDLRTTRKEKWYEVGYFATYNDDEDISIIAKFLHADEAIAFCQWYLTNRRGFVHLILR